MIKYLYDIIIQRSVQLTAIILLTVSLAIFLNNDHAVIRNLQTEAADLAAPIKEPVIWFERRIKAQQENIELEKRLIELTTEFSRVSVLHEENRRLRAMLDFRSQSRFELTPALVISAGLQNNMNGILLNKGSRDSVRVNEPIVNVDGVVGKIYQVGERSSLGQILAEPNARISVNIRPSSAKGILQWYGGNQFIIKGIPNTIPIGKNNLVVSSGYSDIYPPNLPVGIVTETQQSPDGFTTTVYGRLLVEFNRLEEVFIINRGKTEPLSRSAEP